MALTLVKAPAVEPVSLDEAKQHLRVDVVDDDGLIDGLIVAARQYAEAFTGRALVTQTWDLKLDAFPCASDGAIVLPKPPVSAITSISYIDGTGTTQTWGSSNYQTDLPTGPTAARARIVPAYSITYPTTRGQMNAVTVRFVCGYGNATAVPDGIKQGIKLLVGHWFANREPVIVGTNVAPLPMAVDALFWPFRSF